MQHYSYNNQVLAEFNKMEKLMIINHSSIYYYLIIKQSFHKRYYLIITVRDNIQI